MAELHVQTKKTNSSPAWIWIVIGLVIAAAVIYFVTRNKETTQDNNTPPANTSSQVQYGMPSFNEVTDAQFIS